MGKFKSRLCELRGLSSVSMIDAVTRHVPSTPCFGSPFCESLDSYSGGLGDPFCRLTYQNTLNTDHKRNQIILLQHARLNCVIVSTCFCGRLSARVFSGKLFRNTLSMFISQKSHYYNMLRARLYCVIA